MIYKSITVKTAAKSNVAEEEFLNKKDQLAEKLVSQLSDKLKLTVTGKSVGAATGKKEGASVQVNLKFDRSPQALPDTSEGTGRFAVTKQGDDLSVNFNVANWRFADDNEFKDFTAMWTPSVSRLLKELVESTYPYKIKQI